MNSLLLSLVALSTSAIASTSYDDSYELQLLAESPYQWTGIAVSESKRLFVNFPTWTVPSPYKVAEIVDGKTVAYPDAASQAEFACVQSVFVDAENRLWVLDPAPRVMEREAKLFQIDLATNKIVKTYVFPFSVASMKSYLNDVRLDTQRGYAYITDSALGGIVVLNLATGESWRALDHTVAAMRANLKQIDFATTEPFARPVHSDGIAISQDAETLYVTALTGDVLYRIPTAVLRDRSLSVAQRAAAITVENAHNVATDGMINVAGTLYMGDLAGEGVWTYNLATKQGTRLKLPHPVRWADSFSKDKQGHVYFTTAQLNYKAEHYIPFQVYKLSKKKSSGQ